jgi:pyridoxal phosphate enzyme (YggS family)
MTPETTPFSQRAEQLLQRIAQAAERAGRSPSAVELLPVSKNHPVEAVAEAVRFGFKAVAENRVQEAADKKAVCPELVRWELIGHLQSNKAKLAVSLFDRIQSVDSVKLAEKLDTLSEEAGRKLPILLQVNAGEDPAKYGIAPNDLDQVLDRVLSLPHLVPEGLMTIAPLSDNPTVARRCFARLRELRDQASNRSGLPLPVLSMGMSDDLEEAIAEGSTLLRIGTALFGER